MSKKKILELLDGCEVNSIEKEGVVLIKGEFGFVNGKKFKITNKDAQELWEEYKYNEGF